MKNKLTLLVLCVFIAFISCDKEENTDLPMEFTVDSYSNVSVAGQVKVQFNSQSSSLKSASVINENDFIVKIASSSQQRKAITIKSEGGVLTIEADGSIVLSDGVTVELSTMELDEIRLENDQEAEFVGWFNQEELTVVTESRSKLSLLDVKINNLTCRTEGESEFNLTTYSELLDGDQTFEEPRGIEINDSTLLVDDSYIVTGNSVKLENAIWTVYGETVSSTYQMTLCDFVTQGETNIDAEGAASKNVDINLEGQTQAKVWTFESITGKGEGESVLYYVDVTGLDFSEFITMGSAQILPIE